MPGISTPDDRRSILQREREGRTLTAFLPFFPTPRPDTSLYSLQRNLQPDADAYPMCQSRRLGGRRLVRRVIPSNGYVPTSDLPERGNLAGFTSAEPTVTQTADHR